MSLRGILTALGLACLPLPGLAEGVPLHLAAVIREGVPPYEGEKRFRLEGEGAGGLRKGERIRLWRFNERRRLAELVVVEVKAPVAFARVLDPGETFPLKGDLVCSHEPLAALPDPGWAWYGRLGAPARPQAPNPKVPASLNPGPPRRETLYFLPGSAELSPAGRQKLKDWVALWGLDGRWSLGIPASPQVPEDIRAARIQALREALAELGVPQLDCRSLPAEAPGAKESLQLSKDPW